MFEDKPHRQPAVYPTSSFHKALWCGAVTFVIAFLSLAATLPGGGNYWGMAGALTVTCFAPAVASGWIAGWGGKTRSWITVITIYVFCFIVWGVLSAAGRQP